MALDKLFEQKYRGESWGAFARRLGNDARYEGKPLDTNPFPSCNGNGPLYGTWKQSWQDADVELSK